jgi:hypothetical protein
MQLTFPGAAVGHSADIGRIIPADYFRQGFMREAGMSWFRTRGRRDHAPETSDFRFVIGAVIVAITAILLSFATGGPELPDGLMLVAL